MLIVMKREEGCHRLYTWIKPVWVGSVSKHDFLHRNGYIKLTDNSLLIDYLCTAICALGAAVENILLDSGFNFRLSTS